jgi:hypothetical protein
MLWRSQGGVARNVPSSGFHLTPPGWEMSRSPLEPKIGAIPDGPAGRTAQGARAGPGIAADATGVALTFGMSVSPLASLIAVSPTVEGH